MTIYNIEFVLEVDEIGDMSTREDAYTRHLSPSYKQKEFVLKEWAKRMYFNKQQTENILNYFLTSTEEGEDFDIELEERY